MEQIIFVKGGFSLISSSVTPSNSPKDLASSDPRQKIHQESSSALRG